MSEQKDTDQGPDPYVVDIEQATLSNENYRTTLWTGAHLQMTVMMIEPGRRHRSRGSRHDLSFDREVGDNWAILVPAGTWHNVVNVGDVPSRSTRCTPRRNTPTAP